MKLSAVTSKGVVMANFGDVVQIARNARFQDRVNFALVTAAINVMTESNQTEKHGNRVDFARNVINGTLPILPYAISVGTSPAIAAEAVLATTPDYAIPDADIQFTVNSMFNSFAGIGS